MLSCWSVAACRCECIAPPVLPNGSSIMIASKLGAMAEIIDDGRTGLHFKPGDHADLVSKDCDVARVPALTDINIQAFLFVAGSRAWPAHKRLTTGRKS
jgi:hypothetical protein